MTDDNLWNRYQIAKRRSLELLQRDAHSDFMDECVPRLMDMGKDQLVAVAACLNIWRDSWEESHPDGADDPGPSRPDTDSQRDERRLRIARQRLRDDPGG